MNLSSATLVLRQFFAAIWLVFMAIWPLLMAELISRLLALWLQIGIDSGTKLAIALATVTGLMLLLFIGTRDEARASPPESARLGAAKMRILLLGSLFCLALVLGLAYEGVLNRPLTLGKLALLLVALIPALEGALAWWIVERETGRLSDQITGYIDTVLQHNNRVTQHMIEGHLQDLGSDKALTPEALTALVRSTMTGYINENAPKREQEGGFVVLDTYQEPGNWKLLQ
jgi:hypothetical protein